MGSVGQSTLYVVLLLYCPLYICASNHISIAYFNADCEDNLSQDVEVAEPLTDTVYTLLTFCDMGQTSVETIFKNATIDVFVGTLDYNTDRSLIKYAEFFNRPFITPFSPLPHHDNTKTLAMSASFEQTAVGLSKVLEHFRWKEIVIIATLSEYWMEMGNVIFIKLSVEQFVTKIYYTKAGSTDAELEELLQRIKTTQKAIIICADVSSEIRILQTAAGLQMHTAHAFFTFAQSPYLLHNKELESLMGDEHKHIVDSLFELHPMFKPDFDPVRRRRSIRRESHNDGTEQLSNAQYQYANGALSKGNSERMGDHIDTLIAGDISAVVINTDLTDDMAHIVRHKRSLTGVLDIDEVFIDDCIRVLENVVDVSNINRTHMFINMANKHFEITSGDISTNQENEILFDFVLNDFNADLEYVKVQEIIHNVNDTWTLVGVATITWPNGVRLEADECFLPGSCTESSGLDALYVLAIVIAVLFVAAVATAVVFIVWRNFIKKEMSKGHHKLLLTSHDLVFLQRKDVQKGSKIINGAIPEKPDLLKASERPSRSMASLHEYYDVTDTARYNGDLVHVKQLRVKGFEMKNKVLQIIKSIREIRHENVNALIGFYDDQSTPAIISDYCNRGSLEDVLNNSDIKLDWDFKVSLLTDLVKGIRFMHNSAIRCHGNLKSRNCVIDSRWVLKVTDYGLAGLMEAAKALPEFEDKDLLFKAPEHLRHPLPPLKGSEKGDVYSIAIIMQCIVLRTYPYSTTGYTPKEIIQKLRHPPPLLRPSVPHGTAPPEYIQIMKVCWSENPDLRPNVEDIYQQFKNITGGKKMNIVDTMFRMLEKYSTDLEDLVRDRTLQLEEEKKKTDTLLYRMLPPIVADNLKVGQTVKAEQFAEVTIYFSDIVGFTTISAMSTPMEVVDLLNDLYTMFDATINNFDVYKVETIGDAYMVVSGLPLKNGNRHAGEITMMALDLLVQCGSFSIKHMPDVPLRVRIGLHSGSVVAGVVGLTMPRYCLFGDTVNVASRMESTGAAYRIHISEECKNMLDELGGYHTEYRGEIELKGKGMATTYWLTGKEGFHKPLPEPPPLTGLNICVNRKLSTNLNRPPSMSEHRVHKSSVDSCQSSNTIDHVDAVPQVDGASKTGSHGNSVPGSVLKKLDTVTEVQRSPKTVVTHFQADNIATTSAVVTKCDNESAIERVSRSRGGKKRLRKRSGHSGSKHERVASQDSIGSLVAGIGSPDRRLNLDTKRSKCSKTEIKSGLQNHTTIHVAECIAVDTIDMQTNNVESKGNGSHSNDTTVNNGLADASLSTISSSRQTSPVSRDLTSSADGSGSRDNTTHVSFEDRDEDVESKPLTFQESLV